MFHADSYGYRPSRSALHAVEVTRRRCWEQHWVVDLDIEACLGCGITLLLGLMWWLEQAVGWGGNPYS